MAEKTEKRVIGPTDKELSVAGGTTDKSQHGHPGLSQLPFVYDDYYKQFPEKFRPLVVSGSGSDANLKLSELTRIRERFEKPFLLQTFINMGLTPYFIQVFNVDGTGVVMMKVPPFGALRTLPDDIVKLGKDGSWFPRFFPISAEGNCDRDQFFTGKDQRRYETCKFSNCEHHPMMDMIHSVQHGLHFISSIGEALEERGSGGRAAYIPEDTKWLEKQIWAYNKYDARPACTQFAARRMQEFSERSARREARRQAGELDAK